MLSCENNNLVLDIASSSKFRVDKIFHSMIVLERYDDRLNDTTCHPKFNNTMLNKELFEYNQGTKDLYMFYGCPLELQVPLLKSGIRNNFTCKAADGNKQVIFGVQSLLQDYFEKLNKSCQTPIRLPVNEDALEMYSNLEAMPLVDLLARSFKVHYKINHTACSYCRKSGGVCWKNTDFGLDPICLHDPGNRTSSSYQAPPPLPPPKGNNKGSGSKIIVAVSAAGGGVIAMLSVFLLLVLFIYHRNKTNIGSSGVSQNVSSNTFLSDCENGGTYMGVPTFSYNELEKATNNFESGNELGNGMS